MCARLERPSLRLAVIKLKWRVTWTFVPHSWTGIYSILIIKQWFQVMSNTIDFVEMETITRWWLGYVIEVASVISRLAGVMVSLRKTLNENQKLKLRLIADRIGEGEMPLRARDATPCTCYRGSSLHISANALGFISKHDSVPRM